MTGTHLRWIFLEWWLMIIGRSYWSHYFPFWIGFNNCRRLELEKQLASSQVSEEEQINILKDLEQKETQYMRLKRHKICVDDFDLLTIIGRGAFGEVRCLRVFSKMKLGFVFIIIIIYLLFFSVLLKCEFSLIYPNRHEICIQLVNNMHYSMAHGARDVTLWGRTEQHLGSSCFTLERLLQTSTCAFSPLPT